MKFEDPFEDEFEEEEKVDPKEWEDVDEDMAEEGKANEDDNDKMDDGETEEVKPKKKPEKEVWLGKEEMEKDEELVFENSAYEMIHRANCEWPSLSIDVLLPERIHGVDKKEWFPHHVNTLNPEKLVKEKHDYNGQEVTIEKHSEDIYPYNVYMVAGSQALKRTEN